MPHSASEGLILWGCLATARQGVVRGGADDQATDVTACRAPQGGTPDGIAATGAAANGAPLDGAVVTMLAGPPAEADAGTMAIAVPAEAEAREAGQLVEAVPRPSRSITPRRRTRHGSAPVRRRSRTPTAPRALSDGQGCTPRAAGPGLDPMDVVFDLLREAAPRPGASVPRRLVEQRAAERGLSSDMFREALENWYSLNLLDWPGFAEEVGLTAEAWCTQMCHLVDAPGGGPANVQPGRACRPIALLPFFDGLGTARLAVQDVLEELGHAGALEFVAFAELDSAFAAVVEAH